VAFLKSRAALEEPTIGNRGLLTQKMKKATKDVVVVNDLRSHPELSSDSSYSFDEIIQVPHSLDSPPSRDFSGNSPSRLQRDISLAHELRQTSSSVIASGGRVSQGTRKESESF